MLCMSQKAFKIYLHNNYSEWMNCNQSKRGWRIKIENIFLCFCNEINDIEQCKCILNQYHSKFDFE